MLADDQYHPYTKHRTVGERRKAMCTNFRDPDSATRENRVRMVECREAYEGYLNEILRREEYCNYRTAKYNMMIPCKGGSIWVHPWDYRMWASPLDVAAGTYETMWMAQLPHVPPMLAMQQCIQEGFNLSQGDEARKEILLYTNRYDAPPDEMREEKKELESVVQKITEQIDPNWLQVD